MPHCTGGPPCQSRDLQLIHHVAREGEQASRRVVEPGVAEAGLGDHGGRDHARIGTHVLLHIGDNGRTVQVQPFGHLVLIAPAVTAEPGGFGRLLEVHAQNELVLIDGASRALLVVIGQAAGDEIGRRVEFQKLFRGLVDARRGNDVAGERRRRDRAVGVLDAGGGIVDQVGDARRSCRPAWRRWARCRWPAPGGAAGTPRSWP